MELYEKINALKAQVDELIRNIKNIQPDSEKIKESKNVMIDVLGRVEGYLGTTYHEIVRLKQVDPDKIKRESRNLADAIHHSNNSARDLGVYDKFCEIKDGLYSLIE